MNAQSLPQNSEEREGLLREVKYRMSYRGTLELDTLCRRVLPQIEMMGVEALREIRDFLLNGENELMAWLVDGKLAPQKYAALVALFKGR